MRTRFLAAIAVALAIPAVAFIPLVFAGTGKAASSSAPPPSSARSAPSASQPKIYTDAAALALRPHDPRNQTNISDFMQMCLDGNGRYLSRDFDGAVDTYRKAIQLSVKDPLGYYLLGEAQLAKGNVTEAEESWKNAERVSDPSVVNNPALRARILFVLADIRERQKKWDDAKTAWGHYDDWASGVVEAGTASDGGYGAFPANGAGRIQSINTMLKQDKDYDRVRAAIRNSADGGLFTNLDASPG